MAKEEATLEKPTSVVQFEEQQAHENTSTGYERMFSITENLKGKKYKGHIWKNERSSLCLLFRQSVKLFCDTDMEEDPNPKHKCRARL